MSQKTAARDSGRKRRFLLYPETLVVVIAVAAYIVDRYLGVIGFLYGYFGFIIGTLSTPITPYSLFMSGAIVSGISVVLYIAGVRWWRGFIIGLSTAFSALVFYEFLWDFTFLVKSWPPTSWFDFPLPLFNYIAGFMSLTAFWLVGIRYWKFSWLVVALWTSFLAGFALWYMIGYPQNLNVFKVNTSYFLNAYTKIMLSLAFMSPVMSWGYRSTGRITIASKHREDKQISPDSHSDSATASSR